MWKLPTIDQGELVRVSTARLVTNSASTRTQPHKTATSLTNRSTRWYHSSQGLLTELWFGETAIGTLLWQIKCGSWHLWEDLTTDIKCQHIRWGKFSAIMSTSLHGNAFRQTDPLWGESTDRRWNPLKRARNTIVYVFFDGSQNKWLTKQPCCWWFESTSL